MIPYKYFDVRTIYASMGMRYKLTGDYKLKGDRPLRHINKTVSVTLSNLIVYHVHVGSDFIFVKSRTKSTLIKFPINWNVLLHIQCEISFAKQIHITVWKL